MVKIVFPKEIFLNPYKELFKAELFWTDKKMPYHVESTVLVRARLVYLLNETTKEISC